MAQLKTKDILFCLFRDKFFQRANLHISGYKKDSRPQPFAAFGNDAAEVQYIQFITFTREKRTSWAPFLFARLSKRDYFES
ncbi:hypothetical protein AL538_13720 [Vibrio harveyi]|uniref:Uncharacterized protein n=1 Tax=Vibrio harveyi TaxID=669 RepID=A0ABM5XZC8_VIBHA|nr:hypothetical protein AL538_13720 [Vibrio harveyi]